MSPITVAIADYDEVERNACEYLLRHERDILVMAEAATAEEVPALVGGCKPRILLCNVGLAAAGGFSLLRSLQRNHPATLVVLVDDRPPCIHQAMRALNGGARGYLSQETLGCQLVRAVRRVNAGEIWMPRQMLGQILEWTAG